MNENFNNHIEECRFLIGREGKTPLLAIFNPNKMMNLSNKLPPRRLIFQQYVILALKWDKTSTRYGCGKLAASFKRDYCIMARMKY